MGGYAKCSPLKVRAFCASAPRCPALIARRIRPQVALPRPPPSVPLGHAFNATELAAVTDNSTQAGMMAYNAAVANAVSQTALWSACNRKYNAAIGGTLTIFFLLLLYGGLRRAQMRRKFGLPGDTLNDICSWLWCSWAALCQETRTLRQFGVRDGVWGAEAVGAQDKASLLAPGSIEMKAGPSAV